MNYFLSFLCGTVIGLLYPFFPVSLISMTAVSVSILVLKKRYFLACFLIAGILHALLRAPSGDISDLFDREIAATGHFSASRITASGNIMKTFEVEDAVDKKTEEEIDDLKGKEITLFTDMDTSEDEDYTVLIRTGKDRKRANPGTMLTPMLSGSIESIEDRESGSFSFGRFFDRSREKINGYLLKRFDSNTAGLLAAMTTGEMGYLAEETKGWFSVTGLAHILSISGTHFGLLSVMLFACLVFLVNRLPHGMLLRITVFITPQQVASLFCLPLLAVYLGISGSSIPAVRSFVMVVLFLVGLLIGRKGMWLNSLLFAAFLLILWDPAVVLSISFQLSFLAVLFIGYAVEKKDETKPGRLDRFLVVPLKLSLAASLGTALLVAYYFHYFSLISPLTNLIVAPFIGFIIIPLSLAASFSYLLNGHYLFSSLIEAASGLAISAVRLAAKVPYADIKVPSFPPIVCIFFYGGLAVYMLSGKKRPVLAMAFIPLILILIWISVGRKEMSVTFLDVGQGDSSVIELAGGRTIVVDTGRTGRETADFLAYRGKREIDALVLTHVHPDHTGGLEHLKKRFSIKEVWDNGRIIYPDQPGTGPVHRTLDRGDIVKMGGAAIEVLHPYTEFHTSSGNDYDDENNASLVFKLKGRHTTLLFAGDIEEEAEQDLKHLGNHLRSDVIKVPHHGSRMSAGADLLREVSPSVAVISVGRDNSFGHPSAEVVGRLTGTTIFRTDKDGAIRIMDTESGVRFRTYRDFAFEKAATLRSERANLQRLFAHW